jgi:hypothetical protein
MPALPVYMLDGYVAIYGIGTATGVNGLRSAISGFKFGTIYQMGQLSYPFEIGNSVLFRESASGKECRLVTTNNLTFTIVEEARLVIQERF